MVDGPFVAANNVLVGQCRKLKASGKDVSKHYPAIKKDDLCKMYSSRVLSVDNPVALQRKVFFEVVLHFGRRGREGLRDINKSDIHFKVDENGKEYATLGFNPLEKNHQGFSSKEGEHQQQMYGSDTENCPLASFKFYLSKLNESCEAFFQRPRSKKWEASPSWYENSPVGFNTLAKMMSIISDAADLSIRYTNHSIRATTVTMLRSCNVDPTDIIGVTGHRNVQSLAHYCQGPGAETRAFMSNTLAQASIPLSEPCEEALTPVPLSKSSVTHTVPSDDASFVQGPDPNAVSIAVPAMTKPNASSDSALMRREPHAHTVSVPVPAVTMPEMTMVSQTTSATMDVTKYWFHGAVFNNSHITVNLPHM